MQKNFFFRRLDLKESEEKRNERLAIFLGILTLTIIVSLIFWGIPLLVNLVGFLGKLKKSEPETFSEDTIPPVPPQFAVIPEATFSATIDLGGSSEPKSKVEIYLNGELLASTQTDEKGEFQIEKVSLQKGENAFTAKSIDAAGNESALAKVAKVIFDNEPPSLEITDPKDESTFYEQKIEIKGKVESEETRVTVNGHLVLVEKEGNFVYPFELQEGRNQIIITAEDAATNKTEKIINVTFRL